MSKARTENPQVFRGIMLVMTAVAVFSVLDSLSKYLTRFYPINLVVWARFTFHLLLVVVVLGPRYGLALVRTARPGIQIMRGLLLAIASVLFVSALKYMPLAETSAIAFLAPLLVTMMSVLFLKEKVELARWIAVLCGFIGVLAIIRPGSSVFTWAVFLPMGNAIAYAAYQVLTRRLAGLESPYTSIFYAGLVGALLLSAMLPFSWVAPQSGLHIVLLVLNGMLGGLGHLILIKAFEHAPASRLAPFSYTQLIWVTVIGYLTFGDFPDAWSLAGIAILMASGIYTATHQRNSDRLANGDQTNLPPGA
jgi:drug/metabolite transporter (DMT)-like permease